MAKRTPAAKPVFSVAERTILGLYDGGVLSPAVLQRVIAGFAESGIDWSSPCALHSVDDKSLHEVVALTMMPGRTIRDATKDFGAVIAHLHGVDGQGQTTANEEPDEDLDQADDQADDDVIGQLGGSAPGKTSRKSAASPKAKQGPAPGFNPLFRASAPGRASK